MREMFVYTYLVVVKVVDYFWEGTISFIDFMRVNSVCRPHTYIQKKFLLEAPSKKAGAVFICRAWQLIIATAVVLYLNAFLFL